MTNAVVANKYSRPFIIEENDLTCNFIYSKDQTQHHDFCVKDWFDYVCKEFGSSVEGRMKSFQAMTESKQKSAILVSEISHCIYFPIRGITQRNNVWVLYNSVMDFQSIGSKRTRLYFSKNLVYEVDVDYRTIKEQMNRCQKFDEMLSGNQRNEHFSY